MSKINSDGLKRGNAPFGLPKDTYSVGETGYIVIYGIIRTSFISKDVYVNTSGTVTDSSTNQFSYLGLSNAYGDVLFNGLAQNIQTPGMSKTNFLNKSNQSASFSGSFTAPRDGFIYYYLFADGYYAYLDVKIGGNYFISSFRGAESGSSRSTSGTFFVKKGTTVEIVKSGSNSGAATGDFRG